MHPTRYLAALALTLGVIGFSGCSHVGSPKEMTPSSRPRSEQQEHIARDQSQRSAEAAYRRLEEQNSRVGETR